MHKAIKVLLIFNGLFMFAGGFLGPLYAVYAGKFADDVLSISISWSAFLLSTTLFTLLISRIKDKAIEKSYLLMAGFALRGLAWFLYIFVFDLTTLIILQILLGLGEALGTPAFNSIFAEHLDQAKHIRDYSDLQIIATLTTALGTLVGGVVVKDFGFQVLFIAMSALAWISLVGIFLNRKSLIVNQN